MERELPRSERSGDETPSLAVAFEECFADLFRYAYLRVGQDSAEDVAAETFVRAASGFQNFDPSRSTLRAWLFGIENNVIRESLRRTRRQRLILLKMPLPDAVESQHSAAELLSLFQGLSQKDSEVILMVDAFGMTYSEVAASLGIPVGTVRSRLAVARRRLRRAFKMEDI